MSEHPEVVVNGNGRSHLERLMLVAKHAPRELPAALETASFYIEQESLDPLCEVMELVCQKLVEVHGREAAAPIMLEMVQRLSKIIHGHTTAGVTTWQRELDRVREALEQKKVECDEVSVLKRGVDQSLQLLAGELDTHKTLIDELNLRIAEDADEAKQARASLIEHYVNATTERDRTISELERCASERRETLGRLKRSIDEKDCEFAKQEQAFKQLEQAHIVTMRAHDRLEIDIGRKDSQLAEQDQALRRLERAHVVTIEAHGRLELEIAEREGTLARTTEELQQERRRYLDTRQALDTICGSNAYRFLIRPLWAALMVLKRPRAGAVQGWRSMTSGVRVLGNLLSAGRPMRRHQRRGR